MKKEGRNSKITIQGEIQKVMIVLLAVSLALVGGISCWMNYSSTIDTLEDNMKATAQVASEQVTE